MNRNQPVAEQRPNRLAPGDWVWANTIHLKDPESSSQVDTFSADRVLQRQLRVLTKDKKYNLHGDATAPDAPWASSCAVTKETDSPSYWKAKFVNGATNVAWV